MGNEQATKWGGQGPWYLEGDLVAAIRQAAMLAWRRFHGENLQDAVGHIHKALAKEVACSSQG